MVLSEYLIKSKIGKTFANEKVLKEYYVITYEINLFFYTNYKEKLKVDKNGHEYIHLEFMFIFLNIIQLQKLMKNYILTEILFLKRKGKKDQKKNLIVNLLQLILIKKTMMYFMKLVEYKHLLVSLKIKNKRIRRRNKKNKKKKSF